MGFSRAGGGQVAAQMIRAEGRRVFENVGPDHDKFQSNYFENCSLFVVRFLKF
jgi:hypothetical protein